MGYDTNTWSKISFIFGGIHLDLIHTNIAEYRQIKHFPRKGE